MCKLQSCDWKLVACLEVEVVREVGAFIRSIMRNDFAEVPAIETLGFGGRKHNSSICSLMCGPVRFIDSDIDGA